MSEIHQKIARLVGNKLKTSITHVGIQTATETEITGICVDDQQRQVKYRVRPLATGGYFVETGEEVKDDSK